MVIVLVSASYDQTQTSLKPEADSSTPRSTLSVTACASAVIGLTDSTIITVKNTDIIFFIVSPSLSKVFALHLKKKRT